MTDETQIKLPQADSGPFNDEQSRTIANDLIAAGRITREQADEALIAEGVKPTPTIERPTVDVSGFPAAQLHEFKMPQWAEGGDVTPDHIEFDKQIRTALVAGGFEKAIGSAVVAELVAATKRTEGMDDSALELHTRSELIKLQKLWRDPDTYQRRMGMAAQLIDEIEAKVPGVKQSINSAGFSAAVVANIALHAERLYTAKHGDPTNWKAPASEQQRRGIFKELSK